jgi:Ca2+-binding EF-hand superfamily protein
MGYADNEFTQLMKGLQGERLRQAFRYFDDNQDGLIRPDQFKRIMLVRPLLSPIQVSSDNDF